ncbi:MAG: NADH:flavin oxidoreductase/NADH oxidase [Naasia sp.]|jgi:2,4-dienoyl-CoA reductase-like NADH-dependent reductase (Old Yellow Enzyme family)|uniref:NADH:flavin oxidoreductase/NADH oxidase n=1 Tax=Naasia sp. TaxID=2546198 RepID=UPI002601A210|nr:NADH:flavin oxidoreductase/NADH oxidase [Naasia sp.]MCU1571582.1 NADH:flavin oxidoreductase/NADH oxidase [Naasia sp.]
MPSALFAPLTVRGVTIRNRIWVSPLCQYSVQRRDGVPTDWHLVHLGSMAVGGAGLVMSEATAVVPEGRISAQDTGIWNDEQAQAWRRIVDFLHERGAVAGMQLAHAGRKASVHPELGGRSGSLTADEGAWTTVAPSVLPFPGLAAPIALDVAGIDAVVEAFAEGAERAVAAGFDLVEVHAAHGYLLHEFLSPLSNLRTDEYGGSLENRARIVLRVVRAIRQRVGESVPVFVRFSGTDWVEDGWSVQDTATVAGWARTAGADLFDVSSGGSLPGVPIPVGPGYQVPLAAHVKAQSGVAVSAVGLVTEPAQAEEIIAAGHADAVMMGRQLMREPHFPLRAAHELGVVLDYWPAQYLRARWR